MQLLNLSASYPVALQQYLSYTYEWNSNCEQAILLAQAQ